MTVFFIFV